MAAPSRSPPPIAVVSCSCVLPMAEEREGVPLEGGRWANGLRQETDGVGCKMDPSFTPPPLPPTDAPSDHSGENDVGTRIDVPNLPSISISSSGFGCSPLSSAFGKGETAAQGGTTGGGERG